MKLFAILLVFIILIGAMIFRIKELTKRDKLRWVDELIDKITDESNIENI